MMVDDGDDDELEMQDDDEEDDSEEFPNTPLPFVPGELPPSGTQTIRFPDLLGPRFSRLLLGLLLRNAEFTARATGIIETEYFASQSYQLIYQTLSTYWKTHGSLPTEDVLNINLNALAGGAEFAEEHCQVAETLWRTSSDEYDAEVIVELQERLVEFVTRARAATAVSSAARHLHAFDVQEHHEETGRILQLKALFADVGTDLRVEWSRLFRKDIEVVQFPTGFVGLDAAMRGGLRPGELCSMLAPLKKGKSTLLMNIGAGLMRNGFRVAHITLEMYTDDVLARYCSLLTGTPTNTLRRLNEDGNQIGYETVRQYMEDTEAYLDAGADIIIKEFPARSCSVDMLDGFLTLLQTQPNAPRNPDGTPTPIIPVIDYADLLVGPKIDEWKELPEIYMQLRNLAKRRQVPIITASQTNAGGFTADALGPQHQSGSTRKGFVVDYMWALDQSEEDYDANRFTLTPILNRNDRKNMTTYWVAAYDSGQLTEIPAQEYLALAREGEINMSKTIPQRAVEITTAVKTKLSEAEIALLQNSCIQHLQAVEQGAYATAKAKKKKGL